MNRRNFLSTGAALLATPLLADQPKEPKDKKMLLPVVDTHQHLWDLKKLKISWVKPGSDFDKPFTPVEYAKAIDGLNVTKSIYMEVDVDAESLKAEAEYVLDIIAEGKTTMVGAVIGGKPASEQFAGYISAFKDTKGLKGVRQVLQSNDSGKQLLKDEFVKGLQLLGDLGLSFDLCIRPTDLGTAAKLVDKCPDTRFILDHCGNPNAKFTKEEFEAWKSALNKLAERKNILVKLSGIVANGYEAGKWKADDLAPAINTTIEAFGVKRCVYGGDWPVCTKAATYAEWLTAFRQIIASRPEADQKAILHDNAVKYYGL